MILLEATSPNGNVTAIVEEDGRSVHFYLTFHDAEPGSPGRMKACWVRNLVAAPEDWDVDAMSDGKPPRLPAAFCRHHEGESVPSPDDLELVWFEEGDAAALLERGEILAALPAWAGLDDFSGYARDCLADTPIGSPLPTDPSLVERVDRARESWARWDDESFWERTRLGLLAAIERGLGRPPSQYFAIDQGEWPPRAIVRFDLPDRAVLMTVGVSARPMPGVELVAEDPSDLRRIELAAAFDPACPPGQILDFARYLGAQAAFPWVRGTWLGAGHTIPCDSVPESLGGRTFEAVILTTSTLDTPEINLPEFRDDPINLLWTVPITAAERDLAENVGSGELLGRLADAGHGVVHRRRPSVA